MGDEGWNTLKQLVYERASGCCEYCQTCEANSGQIMQVDHIDPQGDDVLENLCPSCWNCIIAASIRQRWSLTRKRQRACRCSIPARRSGQNILRGLTVGHVYAA